jgi:hypothetical protein
LSIKVALDGKTYIEFTDGRIASAGAVAVWTRADSVPAFDDLQLGALAKQAGPMAF